jgi:hypothetical protein
MTRLMTKSSYTANSASGQRYFDTASTRTMTLILDTSRCSAGLFLAASSCCLESARDVGAD